MEEGPDFGVVPEGHAAGVGASVPEPSFFDTLANNFTPGSYFPEDACHAPQEDLKASSSSAPMLNEQAPATAAAPIFEVRMLSNFSIFA